MSSSRLKNLARNLTTIEVSTIVSSEISGSKFGDPRRALIDLAIRYQMKLRELTVWIDDPQAGEATDGWPAGVHPGGCQSYEIIRGLADQRIQQMGRHRSSSDGTMNAAEVGAFETLQRIRDMSDLILGVFRELRNHAQQEAAEAAATGGSAVPENYDAWGGTVYDNNCTLQQIEENEVGELELTADELTVIRKACTLGTERIALRTEIQLDGDVVTRINERYARPEFEVLHRFHNHSTDMALAYWGRLCRLLMDLAKGFADRFFPKRR